LQLLHERLESPRPEEADVEQFTAFFHIEHCLGVAVRIFSSQFSSRHGSTGLR
jgi:hypothetical protein